MDEIKYLLQNSQNLEYEDFIKDETLKRSFVRSLEVIGEATKNLPDDFRNKYSQVQWKEMAGLRDILIHRYFGVNYKSVWDVIKNKIPKLKERIENILGEVVEEG
ncbi:DUF86 domain-containing protein [Candidatus Poribacteria bacterium]|nr:DUF86 domain-containing protein [Candidatus Poribacteria bacterium]